MDDDSVTIRKDAFTDLIDVPRRVEELEGFGRSI
jgi:hypothetical protein